MYIAVGESKERVGEAGVFQARTSI